MCELWQGGGRAVVTSMGYSPEYLPAVQFAEVREPDRRGANTPVSLARSATIKTGCIEFALGRELFVFMEFIIVLLIVCVPNENNL